MPARTLAFASLLLATGLNTVVGNSAVEAAACSNGGLSTFCTNACPPSATTCGNQLDGSTRLTGTNNACADCTTGWAATGTDDCIAHTTCGKQAVGSTRLTGDTATAPGSCAACAANTAAATGAEDCKDGRFAVFEARTSGFCTDESGGARVGSAAECVEAARAQGYSNTFAYVVPLSTTPRGCYVARWGALYFNPHTSSTTSCGADSSTCMCTVTAPTCTNTDGSAPNCAAPCICGNKPCTGAETTGMHCYASQNRCRKFANLATCAITDGSAANPSACVCGSVDCETAATTGMFCMAALNTCSKDDRFAVLEARTSGYCTGKSGWAWVGSQAECEEAATAQGWSDTTAYVWSHSGYPRGCYKRASSLYFNTYTSSTVSCGTWSSTCMCTLTAPACTNTDGSAPNSAAPCFCGNTECTSDTGLFCVSSSSTCSSS